MRAHAGPTYCGPRLATCAAHRRGSRYGWYRSLFIIAMISVPLEAQTIPDRWEKVDATASGTGLIIQLHSNIRIEGNFAGSTLDEVRVITDRGDPLSIAKTDVREITTTRTYGDSLTNGAVIGGSVGLGVALVVLGLAASGEGYVLESARWGGPLLGLGAGLGAGIIVDAMREGPLLLYRSR